jgi:HK97 family phage major capsid protein
MKKFVNDLIQKRQARLAEIRSLIDASTDVNEVRSLTTEAEAINAEIREAQAQLAALEAKEAAARSDDMPADAELKNGQVRGSFQEPADTRSEEEYLGSMEYRNAFRKYVLEGAPITRNGEVISTQETGAAIPVTVMNDVINTVRVRYGNLYNKVRKLSVPGGVEFPIGSLRATFKWITEATVSPRQKVDALGKVSFRYHTAEIRVAQTFLSNVLTLSSFEARLAEVIAEAYLEAMDAGIVAGTGNGQMLGIVNDPRVTNVVTFTAAQISNWTEWRKRFFSQLPLGYRAGEFIFPLSTVEAYLETMADSNNNPIFRQATGLEVNDGDAQDPNGRFFGRRISLVEPDIIADFDSASSGDVIGIYWQPEEYAINENFGFTMRRYFDDDTNEWVDKALVVVDGKVLNPTGYYLIKKA